MLKTSRRRAFAFLLSVTSIAPATFSPAVFAQGSPDPTVQAAHARFAEGVQFFDKGEFENARAAFVQAYALHKHPAVLMNLAQSSLRSGHTLEAARYFTRYLHESASLTPAQRAEAEKGLAEARQKLGHIEVSAPAATAVTIDGDLAGTDGPITWDVEPGSHTVKGAGDTTTVTVVAGQTVTVKLGKPAVAAVPIPEPPPLPPPAPKPPPEPTPEPTPSPTPSPSTSPGLLTPPDNMTPVWVGAGVSVVGFATAIAFGVFEGSAQSSYNGQVAAITSATAPHSQGACVNPKGNVAAGCASLTSDASDVSSDATAANVGIAAGIIGAGFAVGWYLFAPKTAKSDAKPGATFHIDPLVGPRLGGLRLGVTF